MRNAIAIAIAWLILAATFAGITRNETQLIEFRDTVFARLGFNIPSDTLDIHTGKADCWYE